MFLNMLSRLTLCLRNIGACVENLHDGIAICVGDRLVNARIEDAGACGVGVESRIVGAAVNH